MVVRGPPAGQGRKPKRCKGGQGWGGCMVVSLRHGCRPCAAYSCHYICHYPMAVH
jgi:hypothetical protein